MLESRLDERGEGSKLTMFSFSLSSYWAGSWRKGNGSIGEKLSVYSGGCSCSGDWSLCVEQAEEVDFCDFISKGLKMEYERKLNIVACH